jgi:hypothetical protein
MRPLCVLIFVLLLAPLIPAQEMTIPADLQYDLLIKVLTFDRNLRSRVGTEIVIGIAYQTAVRESIVAKDALLDAIRTSGASPWNDLPVRAVVIELGDPNDLAEIFGREGIDVLYIAPLRAFDVRAIIPVCNAKRVLSFTGVPEYIAAGVSVGFDIKEDRPEILVNLASARLAGADFSSKLLRLVRLVEE